jgi:TRAP-type mannitol/chloroaromatic compound transport system substrate-binding protein
LKKLAVMISALGIIGGVWGQIDQSCGQAPKEKVFKWRAQSFFAAGHSQTEVNKKWCAELKRMTNGRIDITYFGANEIVPTIQAWEACSKGVFEVFFDWSGYWTGKTLMAGYATGIPYTCRNAMDYITIMRGFGLLDMIRKTYAKHNLFLVSSFPTHAQVFMSKFPVNKVADFKGKKIRTAGFMADVLAEAGASPVFLPMGEVYASIERGVVEGTTMAISYHFNYGIHEVTKYLLMSPINDMEGQNLIINMKAWNSLSDDLKILLEHSASNLGERILSHDFTQDVIALGKMKEKGIKLTYLPDDERSKMAGFSEKVLDKYSRKDPEFAKATEMVKNYMRTVGVLK